jgi:hypothetical protein
MHAFRGFPGRILQRAGAIHDRINACKQPNEISRHSARKIQRDVPHAAETRDRGVPTRSHDLVAVCREAGTNGGAN